MSGHKCLKGFTCACGSDHGFKGFKAEEVALKGALTAGNDIPDDIISRIATKDWDSTSSSEFSGKRGRDAIKLTQ